MPEFDRRWIPSVDAVVRQLPRVVLPRPLIVNTVRNELARLRAGEDAPTNETQVIQSITQKLQAIARSRIGPVINGTGVILHTNLGRAPMGAVTAAAVASAASQYSTVEFDLQTGERGRRGEYVELALATLCNAPAATVVNNCAAALMLIINTLTVGPRKRVVISRGELVQIGGGFRVPDILQASGAVLREVGTTNQTNLDDYRRAIGDETALILRVHRSNFYMDGFVASPSIAELATIAREAGVPLIDDIGSGAIFNTAQIPGLTSLHSPSPQEPMPAPSLAAGADVVCFSGDKLLGGPQAGVIAGSMELVGRFKRNPIFRALRCDKLALAALQQTTEHLLNQAIDELPVREMFERPFEALRARGEQMIAATECRELDLIESVARIGGGSLPQAELPSLAIRLPESGKPQALLQTLREHSPPIIATINRDRVLIDLRTVFPQQDSLLINGLKQILSSLPHAS